MEDKENIAINKLKVLGRADNDLYTKLIKRKLENKFTNAQTMDEILEIFEKVMSPDDMFDILSKIKNKFNV